MVTALQTLPLIFRRSSHRRRLRLLVRVLAIVLGLSLLKLLVHQFALEVITVNPLFSALVASTVFLLGFLLNGVLADFKDSEKLPGELASALEALGLEIRGIPAHHVDAQVAVPLVAVADLTHGILAWVRQHLSTHDLMLLYQHAHGRVVDAAVLLRGESTLQGRLMSEMAAVLRSVNRIETIRETSFVPLVYWLANAGAALLCGGLVLMKGSSISESVFFLFVIAFLLIFLLNLIRDIDNPFGFSDPSSAEDVSLEVLEAAAGRLQELAVEAKVEASVNLARRQPASASGSCAGPSPWG